MISLKIIFYFLSDNLLKIYKNIYYIWHIITKISLDDLKFYILSVEYCIFFSVFGRNFGYIRLIINDKNHILLLK
jgi:hypothetical protein